MAWRIMRALVVVAVLHCINQREGGFALRQVVAQVFAEAGFVGLVVERIVDQLEGGADVLAVARERLFDDGRGIAQHGADLRAGLEQPRGLAVNDVEVACLAGVRIACVHELQHFALGDGVGGIGHDVHDAHAVERDHHLKGARIQKIADQDAGGVAEHLVGRLAAAAQRGAVDDVVVQQRGGVNELDDGRRLDVLFAAVSAGARGQQHQKGAQALAAGINDVGGYLIDEGDLAVQTMFDDPVDGLKIGGYQLTNLF